MGDKESNTSPTGIEVLQQTIELREDGITKTLQECLYFNQLVNYLKKNKVSKELKYKNQEKNVNNVSTPRKDYVDNLISLKKALLRIKTFHPCFNINR